LWESFGNRSFAANLGGSGILPFWAAIEPCRRKLIEPAFPSHADALLSCAAENGRFRVGLWREVDAPASLFHREKANLRDFAAAPKLQTCSSQSKSFQDLRAKRHDRKQEKTGGNPPSGHKKPELSYLVLFTPGINEHYKIPSGEDANAENQSWMCACN
jgi:hypothetical protein